jgi:hypothetical protein
MNFISKEDKKIIEDMNDRLHTNYRTTPYDLNNPDDVIEAVRRTTAEYCDMAQYYRTLIQLDESFDETIETFSPVKWAKIGIDGTTGNDTLDNAIACLEEVSDLFNELLQEAETKCIEVWHVAFNHPSDKIILHFFGSNERYDTTAIDTAMDHISDIFSRIEYDGRIDSSAEGFAKELKVQLGILPDKIL